MEGSLSKWTNVMKGWQYRWFVLDEIAGLLSYYTSREKRMRCVRRGCVRLEGAAIGIHDEDGTTFTITVDSKTFHFQAKDSDEREKWVRCLEDTILRHAFGFKCSSSLRPDMIKPTCTMQDFNKKLSEADGYLQLLIDQTKAVENKTFLLMDPDDRHKCDEITSHANNMIEQMKHTIILLQIAKNTAHPINGSYQPINVPELSIPVEPSMLPNELNLCDDFGDFGRHPNLPLPIEVPETSYSSSEDEDFFDANDATPVEHIRDTSNKTDSIQRETKEEEVAKTPSNPELNYYKPDGSLDYDVLYEPCEDTNISMEGSVVTHLLSQVKIGMDLTKVALPTFILERRSLLEMYADYFAHPDLFVEIADQPTEQERMVQVVRWYLCSYHAGRKSTVAKKPYNPVLGEVFQCYWNLGNEEAEADKELVTEGPVPWCNKDQLSFVAEQVSHHPSVSAFYAEHFNKRLTFNAHIWTKSKFLGLSVVVHNIGNGIVSVLDYDEHYVLTFPNGYARSILTTPWIELGGSVTISCEKTGYRAQVEFNTKPFYGGKKHRITAEVFEPSEKKPFLSIAGEWNGMMEAKWSEGRSELFADVNEMTINKKNVRSIDQQDENESRKLWKEVTAGLWLNNVTHASNAKCELEEKQRMAAQVRKEQGIPWETKLFRPGGEDNWVFMRPLAERLTSAVY